ncbi:hypothetical protein BZA05DRAFT_11156 [Tricharina praecox]|uniref:uncharacterized protein n=1 Tax=Tricharina praecox TaxID=43433 RepID=UPI0022210509|nr:uncharacterized protein BZA05DRAFT_11156 [Tricharina praecox]KAI5858704.1 hypothetical protein BZA05DRAFT_11156 [Tricharina praecox]
MAPHAEPTTTSTANGTTAGEPKAPSSPTLKSIEHLKSYPLVADGITTFSSHPIGQKTIALSTSAYSRFIAPLSPYLSKAYPYVNRADELADSSLEKLDSRFPIVKEPTESLRSVVVDAVGYPRKVVAQVIVRGSDFAKEKQEYVFKVYEDEFSKMGEEEKKSAGYIPMAKAGVTTGFVVSSELMGAIATYLGSKKEAVKEEASTTTKN